MAPLPGPRDSSASKKTSVERRALEAPRQVARQLEQDGDARGAVVGAHEAGDVLGVVMGADDDHAGFAARDAGDDVADGTLDPYVAHACFV